METSLGWLGRLADDPTDADWRRLNDLYVPFLRERLVQSGVGATARDDLVQEVLMAVVRRVGEFEHRGPGAFRAWLRGILANHVRTYFRTRRESPAVDLDQLAGDDTALSRLWDREHDEHVALRAMRLVEGDFTSVTWQAFRRQVIDDRPPAEVAAELGVSLNAVIQAKSRVMKRLRAELRGLVE